MRVLLLTTSLITACFSPNEASISQSAAFEQQDLTEVGSPAYIEKNECLIDIESTLKLGTSTRLPRLDSCLPSSKLSWLFETEKVTAQAGQRLKLAVLLDTSYSLRQNDLQGQRYKALRDYLLALHTKISTPDPNADAHITSAEIQIYPFKYCDKRKNEPHSLTIKQKTLRIAFENKVDALIGDKSTYTNKGSPDKIEESFKQLTGYGAVGSTNYLHSLAKAIEFFNGAGADDLKQVLIFSDGLPFTFNDGENNTIDLSASGCGIGHTYTYPDLRKGVIDSDKFTPSEAIKACVTDKFYPQDTCTRPTIYNPGQTRTDDIDEPKAWSDPLNHVLGMVQHSTVISKAKGDHRFQVYAVLLKPSSCAGNGWDKIICEEITMPLAEPFFKSFADSYEQTSQASGLAEKLRATLDKQTHPYHKNGIAKVNGKKVDNPTTLHGNYHIKVGRDNKRDSVYDYKDEPQNTLTVEHGVYYRQGDNFSITYDFEFPASGTGEADCRSSSYSKSGNVEVNKYLGSGYTAWCLLPPRCDASDKCCDVEHQEITAERGQQICANEGGDRIWIGFEGNRRVCKCECNDIAVKACQGEGQSWNTATCTCETSGGGGGKDACVPSDTVCCKNGTAYNVSDCDGGKAGKIWDSTECSCVPDIEESPVEPTCDRTSECCDSTGKPIITPKSCAQGQQWQDHPTCKCVQKNPPIVHTPPTTPTQTKEVPPSGKPGPENPEKTGEEKGEEVEPPPAPTVTEGIIWGDFESF